MSAEPSKASLEQADKLLDDWVVPKPGVAHRVYSSLRPLIALALDKQHKRTAEDYRHGLVSITRKCQQYWNERNITDEEVHAALETIASFVGELNDIRDGDPS